MTRQDVLTLPLAECGDVSLVGGKAVNLGRMIRGGFEVPGGFVVTTGAYAAAHNGSPSSGVAGRLSLPRCVADAIGSAYRQIGGGSVAVRSSATAEDMGSASMAGQYETFLDVEGEDALLDAVQKCWASLDAPRTRAYLQENGIEFASVAMAVVVQRLVAADVAGVVFTSNPHPGRHQEMLLEASWGLGELVVSGRVQPDVLRVDANSGRVIEAVIADKQHQLTAGQSSEREVDESLRRRCCLSGRDIHRLWKIAKQLAVHFNAPQDVEWAIHDGRLYLIQSRPITTYEDAEAYETLLRDTRQQLRTAAAASRGPWVLHNLAETLPHPTPLTWSVIRTFMTGTGGFGTMYRDAGFEPSPLVAREGFLELIAGRIYMDAARAPEMFFEGFPFEYDPEDLKRNPDASQLPPTRPKGSLLDRLSVGRRINRVDRKLHTLSRTLDRTLRDGLFPEIVAYVQREKQRDLKSLSTDELIVLWKEREAMVLGQFAPGTLMPSLVCGMALGELQQFLRVQMWDADAGALAQALSAGGPPSRTLVADAQLYEVGKGERPLETWLAEHGHRAAGEFDLAAPRWREQPGVAQESARRLAEGDGPLSRHEQNRLKVDRELEVLGAKFSERDRSELRRRVDLVRRYVAFREDGKDFFMLGYDLLRDVALEAGRRLEVGSDVFYLSVEDLFDALRVGFAPLHLIEGRKVVRETEARLALPRFIDADMVAALGQAAPSTPVGEGAHKAFAISSGVARGPVKVLQSSTIEGDIGRGYILVCPSTDPSWTPLFVNAAGLIIERGGALSHGAVVARELGLPAVVLPNATSLFKTGQLLQVDGDRGSVSLADDANTFTVAAAEPDADDTSIAPERMPPPTGPAERRAAKLAKIAAGAWTVFLLGFFLLPPSAVHSPALSVLDLVLWPIVRSAGKPATIAIVAVTIACGTLLIQKFLTDNARLLEAKRRAGALKKSAELLPKGSKRREAFLQAAAPVQARTFAAGMVPIGLLLGPLVVPFVWFAARVDPASWNAPAGSVVQVVAEVESDWEKTVTIELPGTIRLDDSTPASVTAPPIRKTLERLLALYRRPRAVDPDQPWELQAAPDLARQQTAEDLQAYLAAGVPPSGITWTVRPPETLSDRFPIVVRTEGQTPVAIDAVVGDQYPPAATSVQGPVGSTVKGVKLAYSKSKVEPAFWRPFGRFADAVHGPFSTWLTKFDVGWFWLYVIVYLPVLVLTRRVLRIA